MTTIPFGKDSLILHEKIGAGATGEVYRAELLRSQRASSRDVNAPTHEECAVKLLHKSLCADHEVVSRYRREVTALMNLRHPAFVQFRGAGQLDDGRVFLVMERVHGDTLASRMKAHGRFPVRATVRMFIDACDAFTEAHGMGIVHRDVKPENLMVEEPKGAPARLRIMDFGFVRFLRDELADEHTALTQAGMTLGTPGFMAMEQLKGEPADHQSDLFAISVSLYEALCGRLPFAGQTPRALFQAQHRGDVVPLTTRLPEEPLAAPLWDVIARALRSERSERTASVAVFADELRAVIGEPRPVVPPRAPALNATASTQNSSQIREIALGSLAAILVIAVAIGVFFWTRGR